MNWFSNWLFVTICMGVIWSASADMMNVANLSECDRKGQLAADILQSRLDGETQEANLEALRKAYENDRRNGVAVPYHVYVDYQRVIRDVFRKDGDNYTNRHWNLETIAKRERNFCLNVGY